MTTVRRTAFPVGSTVASCRVRCGRDDFKCVSREYVFFEKFGLDEKASSLSDSQSANELPANSSTRVLL